MSLISQLLGWEPGQVIPQASAWTSPLWWGDVGNSVAGVAVGPDAALKLSTVYACVGLLSETIASLPLVVYRYLENEQGRERARNHPLYSVLHDQPNESQTAIDFVQMLQAHALLRGSGYAEITPGARGFADQLIPLHPDNVQKEKLTNGRIRYRVRDEQGRERVLNSDSVFEVGGLTLDGWTTVSVVAYARDSFGHTLATEQYGGRFFRNNSRPSGVLEVDKKLSKDAAARLKNDWQANHNGGNAQGTAVLEEGVKWKPISITNEEAQFLQTRELNAEEVCRWFRVPPHMVGLTSKATSWGTGIEEMTIGFLTYTLRPWLTRWRQAIRRDLILAPDRYFVDFVVEELLRGDIKSRYDAYAIARQWGWLSVNEIRQKENMNPVQGGDAYITPLNMTPAGDREDAGARGRGEAANGHYRLLAEESAGRLVRKEIAAVGKISQRVAEGCAEWQEAVRAFYEEHTGLVAQAMRVPVHKAGGYCQAGYDDLRDNGAAAMNDWETRRVQALADLAIEYGMTTEQALATVRKVAESSPFWR